MQNDPRASVVIPAYKAAATIGRAVQSCLDEDAAAEIIVVVDGSDQDLVDAIPKSQRVKVLVNRVESGAPASRNRGLNAASSEFVLFLDADDYIEGGLLGALVQAAHSKSADLAFGSWVFEFSTSGKRISVDAASVFENTDALSVLQRWYSGYFVPCCSVLWRTEFLRKIGGWDEALIKNQDGELACRAIVRSAVIATADRGRGVYVQHASSDRVSQNMSAAALQQQIELLEHFEDRAKEKNLAPAAVELGITYYHLARLAYRNGCDAVGDRAERSAQRLGYVDRAGSILHRLSVLALGLRRKEHLSATLHRARRGLRGAER